MEKLDPRTAAFPQAPSQAQWDALTPKQRLEVVDSLPNEVTDAEMAPSEGQAHSGAKVDAATTLNGYFRGSGRQVYVAMELPVYYPAQPRFAPDVLAVMDVPTHSREKWLVSAEGRGLDWVLEIHVGGDRKKDAEANVMRYAALGIKEYFMYDRKRERLLGHRLALGAKTYKPLLGQGGHLHSEILGLDLVLENHELRFYHSSALLLTDAEAVARLQQMVEQVTQRADAEADRAREARQRASEEAQRASEEAQRARLLEEEVVKLRAALEQAKKRP